VIAPRRELLKTFPNPDVRHDYLVEFAPVLADATRLLIRFVPDRDVLAPDCLAAYLAAFGADWLEALALTMVEDLANQLVPRWVEVQAERMTPLHRVVVEDRQPAWDNSDLLQRIRALPPLALTSRAD
jgi:7-cyano-7-deazaguanine reductase